MLKRVGSWVGGVLVVGLLLLWSAGSLSDEIDGWRSLFRTNDPSHERLQATTAATDPCVGYTTWFQRLNDRVLSLIQIEQSTPPDGTEEDFSARIAAMQELIDWLKDAPSPPAAEEYR